MIDSPYWQNVVDYIARQKLFDDKSVMLVDCSNHSSDGKVRGTFETTAGDSEITRCVTIDRGLTDKEWTHFFDSARENLFGDENVDFERWQLDRVQQIVADCPPLALRAFPETVPDATSLVAEFETLTETYRNEFRRVHNQVRFVGMSVYKEEATGAVSLDRLYIPLRVVPEDHKDEDTSGRTDPLTLLAPGSRHVILGDPGSGKSTLLKFLSLVGWHKALQERFGQTPDERIPLLIVLRQYADELKTRRDLSIMEYAAERANKELGLTAISEEFLLYHLCVGRGIILLDGIDELPGLEFKQLIRDRVEELLKQWPANTVLITSRIVGYEQDARFSDGRFNHHKVARLLPEDVRRFVELWYEERIAGELDRTEHCEDLTSILEDVQNESIRDLASNPLLLTIICLVHRVDGTLPDERVVLYHKCTETLLNTWHNWKFKSNDRVKRNATERRNRARMEFIAYCMQGLFDSTDEEQRAVVPLEMVSEILVDYLEREEPLVTDAEAEADLFLRFVRERAGLLIEVGDGQFSFLHLTFQEYLAATYLKKEMEAVATDASVAPEQAVGIHAVWRLIDKNNRHANTRWHETIRLLVASLERPDAQRFLVENILPKSDDIDASFVTRTLLAGGILLDQVEGAVVLGEEIIERLLRCAIDAEDDRSFEKPFQLLNRICRRCPSARRFVEACVARLSEVLPADERFRLGLVLAGLSWVDSQIDQQLPGWLPESARDCFKSFVADEVELSERLAEAASLTAFVHSTLNETSGTTIAVVGQLIGVPELNDRTLIRLVGRHHAFGFVGLAGAFPAWRDAVAEQKDPLCDYKTYYNRALDRDLALALALARDRALDLARDRARARARARDRDRDRARARARARARDLDLDLDLARDRALELDRDRDLSAETWIRLACFWSVEGENDPRWWQALKTRRIDNLVLPRILPEVIEDVSLESLPPDLNKADRLSHIATWLMFDIAFYWQGQFDSANESPFRKLADQTASSDEPLLRIVHCIRDLAYGDESRTYDLVAMVKSPDPAYQQIFKDAFWID